MKELMLTKGFQLKQYPDGLFWVWESKDTHFMDADHTICQCTEDFKGFTSGSSGGFVEEHSLEEFTRMVEEMGNDR